MPPSHALIIEDNLVAGVSKEPVDAEYLEGWDRCYAIVVHPEGRHETEILGTPGSWT